MQVRTRPLVWGLATLALLIGGLVLWQSNSPSAPDLAPPVATAAVGTKPFVRSMLDTVPDGNLQGLQAGATDASSGPLAYGELKRLFDYYLSAVGEQSIEGITVHLRGELERRLPPAQAKRAQRLLDLYIAFKRELLVLEGKPELSGNAVQAIRARMLAMQDLRARYFSAEETQGMFGFDDAYDMDAVARLEVSQNPALNAEQKKQQLAALDTAMSPVLREAREASLVVVRVEQQAQELRAKGASEDDIYRMRAKAFDPETWTVKKQSGKPASPNTRNSAAKCCKATPRRRSRSARPPYSSFSKACFHSQNCPVWWPTTNRRHITPSEQ